MLIRELITEAAYDSMVDSMRRQFPEQDQMIQDHVRWAKQALRKPDRVTWYLRLLRAELEGEVPAQLLGQYQWQGIQKLGTDIHHFFGFNYAPIDNYQFQRQSVGDVIQDLTKFEQEWQAKQEKTQGVTPQEGDYKLLEFPGYAWWWVDRSFCPEEGRSGSHCGNVTGNYKTDQRILSFRNDNGNVLLTFILEPHGALGEMKAKGNQKPQEKYHPYIMKLLDLDIVKSISSGGYAPHMNFSIFDLKDDQVLHYYHTKPELVSGQVKSTPMELLKAPAELKTDANLIQVATNAKPGLRYLLNTKQTDKDWEQAIVRDDSLIIYAPPTIPIWETLVINYFQHTDDDEAISDMSSAPPTISKNPELLSRIVNARPAVIFGISPTVKNYHELAYRAYATSRYVSNMYDDNRENMPEQMQQAVKEFEADDKILDNYTYGSHRNPEIERVLLKIGKGYMARHKAVTYLKKLGSTAEMKQVPLEIFKLALRDSVQSLEYINLVDNPRDRDELYREAIDLHGNYAYDFIKRPGPELQLDIINQNPELISYIDNPTDKAMLMALDSKSGVDALLAKMYNGFLPSRRIIDELFNVIQKYGYESVGEIGIDDVANISKKEFDQQLQSFMNMRLEKIMHGIKKDKKWIKMGRDTIADYKKQIKDEQDKLEFTINELKKSDTMNDDVLRIVRDNFKRNINKLKGDMADEYDVMMNNVNNIQKRVGRARDLKSALRN